jgi:hypothetical protein
VCSRRWHPKCSTNGLKLAVEPTYGNRERVAQTEIRNPDGSLAGTMSTVVGSDRVRVGYELKLGDKAIDEQDFFALAGDSATAARIASARRTRTIAGNVGGVLMLGGLGGVVASNLIDLSEGTKMGATAASIGAVISGLLVYTVAKIGMHARRTTPAEAYKAIGASVPQWASVER